MGDGRVRSVLITGGAGFIGCNLAARLLETTQAHVSIYDNLSRRHVSTNLNWLRSLPGADRRLQVVIGDVRDGERLRQVAKDCKEIYHLAAQVAVTTSLQSPLDDFETNARGTLNVLEAARRQSEPPFVLFTSTNKVYGALESLHVCANGTRYMAEDPSFRGAAESVPLDFHSPYGCSKGAADQYVRDYARIYNIPSVVFRMSCICGPHQFGTEDQGWVAHFLYSLLYGQTVTIYGDGRQVRDLLHVHDLLDAMEAARAQVSRTRGQVYNVGGGLERSASVKEILAMIEEMLRCEPRYAFGAVRPGDQPLYISDTAKLQRDTGWAPQRSIRQVLDDIRRFAEAHPQVASNLASAEIAASEGKVA
jgi:CDP-paratose 2-epimerase